MRIEEPRPDHVASNCDIVVQIICANISVKYSVAVLETMVLVSSGLEAKSAGLINFCYLSHKVMEL